MAWGRRRQYWRSTRSTQKAEIDGAKVLVGSVLSLGLGEVPVRGRPKGVPHPAAAMVAEAPRAVKVPLRQPVEGGR